MWPDLSRKEGLAETTIGAVNWEKHRAFRAGISHVDVTRRAKLSEHTQREAKKGYRVS